MATAFQSMGSYISNNNMHSDNPRLKYRLHTTKKLDVYLTLTPYMNSTEWGEGFQGTLDFKQII